MPSFLRTSIAIAMIAPLAVQAQAASPREALIRAAFSTPDKAQALGAKAGPGFFLEGDVKKGLADWKKKVK